MDEMRNFRQDLKIDQYALDKMAVNQPDLYAEWAMEWANAVRERDRLKDRLALVRGNCDQDIRERPESFGWTKDKAPTEGFINSAISTHSDYVDANELYQEAQHHVTVMSVAKESFEQRRKMIEVLTQLYLSNYYSGNKKFDVGYQEAVPVVHQQEQSASMAETRKSRLLKRTGATNVD